MKIQNIIYKFLLLYSFLPLFTFFNPVLGQSRDQLQLADSLYEQQRFIKAYRIYEGILEEGKASPGMLLRMAYVQESLGNTVQTLYLLNLYYQQTADREVLMKMEDLAEAHKLKGYAYSDVDYFRNLLYQNRRLIAMGLMLLVGVLFLLVVYRKFRLGQKPVWLGIATVIVQAGLAYFVNIPLSQQQGIIVKDYVLLLSGPSAGAGVVQTLGKGHRLELLNKQDVWFKVEWEGQTVYIKETAVEKI